MSVWEYDGYNQKIDDSGVSRTLRIGRDSGDFIAYMLFEPMSMREENWALRAIKNSLRAGESKSSHAVVSQHDDTHHLPPLNQGEDMTNPNLVVRRLTPLECELLMGWGPGWTAIGVNEDGAEVQMADSHRYKMCGNGVVANVAEWIGVRYLEALRSE